MPYLLSSVGASGEASALAALIATDSVFITCLFTATPMDLFLFGRLFPRPFVWPFLLGLLSRHSQSPSFWSLDRVAHHGGLWYQR